MLRRIQRVRPPMGTAFTSDVVLGERYRDSVSGFEGTATGCFFFLHGCERVHLEQWSPEHAKMVSETFDSPRLVHIETETALTTDKTGGWQPDPAAKPGPR